MFDLQCPNLAIKAISTPAARRSQLRHAHIPWKTYKSGLRCSIEIHFFNVARTMLGVTGDRSSNTKNDSDRFLHEGLNLAYCFASAKGQKRLLSQMFFPLPRILIICGFALVKCVLDVRRMNSNFCLLFAMCTSLTFTG